MKLIITDGLKGLIDRWCEYPSTKQFYGAGHVGALIAVQYGEDYLSNMTVPNSMFERALLDGPEKSYLQQNKDLILIPYFQGMQEFVDTKEALLTEMHSFCAHLPFVLLINGKEYHLYEAAVKAQHFVEIRQQLPPFLGDKLAEFFRFLKKESL